MPSFNGSTSYGMIADDPIFDFSSDFTVCCWMRATNVAGGLQALATKYRSDNNTREWFFSISDVSGEMQVQFGDPADETFQSQFKTSGSGIANGTWHHVGFQQNGTSCSCFVDGQFVTTTNTIGLPRSTIFNGTARVLIGGQDSSVPPGFPFDGQIFDVRIYSPRTTAIFEMYDPSTRWDLYAPTIAEQLRDFVAVPPAPTFNPAWARGSNVIIGAGNP